MFAQLGTMAVEGKGMAPSFRHAREYWGRAIELGDLEAVQSMQGLTNAIEKVTSSTKSPHTTPYMYMYTS